MIPLTDPIKKDLINDVNNFDIMVVIESPRETFYISTREQHFEMDVGTGEVYFEDLGLKISSIKESMDFKTKKVKIAGTSITLNNYLRNELRFTDRAKYGILNSTVRIFIKTGSCKYIDTASFAVDCTEIAKLKVVRFVQNKDTVVLECEEFFSDEVSTELPRPSQTLYSDQNADSSYNATTSEVYNDTRIPILYGHLKEAPAITYIDNETNKTSVIVDRLVFDDPSSMGGVKQMDNIDYPNDLYLLNESVADHNVTQIIDQDTLTVKLGDGGARVYKLAPKQAHGRILKLHWNRQFDIYENYIEFYTEDSVGVSQFINKGALMVGELSKLKSATSYLNAFTVHYTQGLIGGEPYLNYFGKYPIDRFDSNPGDQIDSDLFSTKVAEFSEIGSGLNPQDSVRVRSGGMLYVGGGDINADHRATQIPTMVFEFEDMKSDPDVFSDPMGVELPTDFNLITFMRIKSKWGGDDWDNVYNMGYPRIEMCIFPERVDNISGEDISGDNLSGWQTEKIMGLLPSVRTGATGFNDIGNDPSTSGFDNVTSYFDHAECIKGLCPMRIQSRAFYDGIDDLKIDYKNTFNVPNDQSQDNEINQWRNRGDWVGAYNLFDANSLVANFLHWADEEVGYGLDINLNVEFYGMMMRRTWYQKNAFNNKFFLNAKGRCGASYFDTHRLMKVQGMPLIYFSLNRQSSDSNPDYVNPYSDTLFQHLLDCLGNEKLRYKYLYDETTESYGPAELMLKYKLPGFGDEVGYIFDLDINQIYHGPVGSFNEAMPDDTMQHNIKINGNIYRADNVQGSIPSEQYIGYDIQFLYCKKKPVPYLAGTEGGDIFEIIEVEALDEVNNLIETLPLDNIDGTYESRLLLDFNASDTLDDGPYVSTEFKKLIQYPSAVIEDICSREFGITTTEFARIGVNDFNYKVNFSINKPEEVRDIFQKISQSCNFIYKNSIEKRVPKVLGIKDTYTPSDVNKSIPIDYIESYKFTKTKIEDIALKCKVKYGYSYITEDYTKSTEIISTEGDLLNRYKEYYNLSDSQVEGDEFLLEYEAPYIQDEVSALVLRNHLYELHKNQHLIVDFTLNLSMALELEVGDIIDFKSIDKNNFIYGDDSEAFFLPYGINIKNTTRVPYDDEDYDGMQGAYPYFMITEISKSMKNASIKAIQMHQLDGVVFIPPEEDEEEYIYADIDENGVGGEPGDYVALYDFLFSGTPLGDFGMLAADMNNDGNVDLFDFLLFKAEFLPTGIEADGDIDGDGFVTQADVELAQQFVNREIMLSYEQILRGDFNSTGMIEQSDVDEIAYLAQEPPDPPTPIGDMLFSNLGSGFGLFSCGYINNTIFVDILAQDTIDSPLGNDLQEVMDQIEENGQTLIGSTLTFQPHFSGSMDSPAYYPWLEVAGDYPVIGVEFYAGWTSTTDYFRIILSTEVEGFDSSGIEGLQFGLSLGSEMGEAHVSFYGEPVSEETWFEMFSSIHDPEGFTALQIVGGDYIGCGFDAGGICTGSTHTIAGFDNKTYTELEGLTGIGTAYDITTTPCKIGFSINWENYESASVSDKAKADEVFLLDGVWAPRLRQGAGFNRGWFVYFGSALLRFDGMLELKDKYGNPVLWNGSNLTINNGMSDEHTFNNLSSLLSTVDESLLHFTLYKQDGFWEEVV